MKARAYATNGYEKNIFQTSKDNKDKEFKDGKSCFMPTPTFTKKKSPEYVKNADNAEKV